MNMEILAKKYIEDHRYPLVKVSLPPQKLFLEAKDEQEHALIREHQDYFFTILKHQRVEKRSSRAQALWLAENGVAKVTKVVKNLLKSFGYQNKEGVFLHPEEMLYLLETNRLEVTFVDTSLSIEKAYEVILRTQAFNLTKYKVYKKLAILGYKLVRFGQIKSNILLRLQKTQLKRSLEKFESSAPSEIKKIKYDSSEVELNTLKEKSYDINLTEPNEGSTNSEETKYILNIFNQLKENMPRDYSEKLNPTNPDYFVWSPSNLSNPDPDFNLFICETNIIDKNYFNSNIPSIYAICIDDISFYRFSNVHLPYI